jgi:hypothetical protein
MDREKVIKALHDARRYLEDKEWSDRGASPHIDSINDALAMLKEQEAVVHPKPSCEMTYITDCCCDLCGVQLIREDNFCRCCGKRIEWESR